jgi:CSLREA domain-containing protein
MSLLSVSFSILPVRRVCLLLLPIATLLLLASVSQAQMGASPGPQAVPHSQPLHLPVSDATRRPLAMVSGDFDEDGTPDLVIGYSTADGGSLQLLNGNPEAIAPRTAAGWLAAAHHEAVDPFVVQTEPAATKALPELLLAADVNGDGHLDLVYGSQNSGTLYVMTGDGHGRFQSGQPLRVTVPGGITALAAWRPGAPVTGDALLVGYTANGLGKLGIFTHSAGQLVLHASYALPAPATSITVASLDADPAPDVAIIANGELLVLHGKNALTGGGRLEVLPVNAAESVTAGEFTFDRHAQMQLAVATASGDLVILAHEGFDPTPWTPAQIATTRRSRARNQLSLAQQAGNTGDAPWVEIENHSGVLSPSKGTVLVRSRISGSGGDDVIAVSPGTSERTLLRHLDNEARARSNLSAESSTSSVGPRGNRAAVSSFSGLSSSGNVVAALSMRVNADARTGLVVLNDTSASPDITVPASGNTYYVNTTTDNTGSTTDPSDGVRCTEGSGERCTLRDAITFANDDASDNISAGRSDTIMVPAGTFSLSWQAGVIDGNTNALTHLEVLGPVSILGSTSGGGTIINGSNNDTVFTINPGPFGSFNPSGNSYVFDMAMENLVIENGKNVNNLNNSGNANYVGGCFNWDAFGTGNLTLTDTTVQNCTALWGPGGGIWAQNSEGGGNGTLTISGGTIAHNSTPELGGGMEDGFPLAALSITNTTITGNAANKSLNPSDGDADGSGGGFYLDGRQPPPSTPQSTLTNVTISSNTASNDNGGGIATYTGLQINGSVFSNNSSGGSGGGIWSNTAGDGSPTTIVSSNFLSNSAAATGGAIAVGIETQAEGNILQVSLSRIFGNTATGGASGVADGVSGEGAGEVIATENWWGCNGGPTTAGDGCDQAVLYNGAGSLAATPFATLSFSADKTTVSTGSNINLTVSLDEDSNNNSISGAFPAVATNYPFSFAVSGGTGSSTPASGAFNSDGTATAVLTPTSAGNGSVSVTFDGQTDSINFTATAATTATSLAITAIPSTTYLYGQPSGFTVQLTPSNATGITAANFQVLVDGLSSFGGSPFGLVLIGNNNYQIFGPFNLLGVGSHTLAVNFLGTADFAPSIASVPVNVIPGTVVISDTITPTAPVQGQGGSINVMVGGIGSGVLPTGTLTYAFDGGAANSAVLNAGAAVISIPTTLSAGSHSLSIVYGGDTNYAVASTSVPFSLTSSNYVVTTAADDESTAANCTVQNSTTTGTDSHCTLRDALLAAANAGSGNIYFDSTAFASAQTIALTSGTLNISSNTTITGATTGSGITLQNLVTVSGGGSSSDFSVFTVNSGVTGAAIHNLIITNGYVNTQGGGIYTSGSLTVTGSTFSNNYAAGVPDGGNGGGAIYVNSGVLAVSDSTFSGNKSAPGGAMNVNDGTVTIKQSTFSGNSAVAGTAGGAIFINNGTLAIAGSTFSDNSAAGGGAVFNYATLTATNTIMAGNTGGDCGAGGSNSCPANGANGNVIGVTTAAFTPLGNYGGPTQTLIPLPGSSAICAGLQANIPSGVTTDQRGLPNTNTSYPGYSAGSPCVDAGAVQTNYALSYTQQPSNTESGASMLPAPALALTESGNAFTASGVTIPLTLTGNGLLSGGSAATSAGLATYSSLKVSAAGSDDTLTATLSLNPNLSTPLSLAVTSNSFNVASAVIATLQISAAYLTEGFAVTPFTPVTGSGGVAPLTYSISPGLPAGLSFSTSTGAVTGTPSVASPKATYIVTITDAANATKSASFTLAVNGPLKATQAIASVALTQNHAATFTPVTGSGGVAPLTYSVAPGLPNGLSFSASTGAITGTPTLAGGPASYTVTVTDSNGATASASFTLTVNPAVTATQAISLIVLTQNHAPTPFTPVTGSGGSGTLTYSVAPALPAGLSLNTTTGTITGTPTSASVRTTYTVTVTDTNGATASAKFSLTVNAAVTATEAIASEVLTQNRAATSFTPVTGAGGSGTLTYSVAPALPAGLSLNTTTGTITGTPTSASARTTYTLTVTDANGATATASFTITVNAAVTATQVIASELLTFSQPSVSFTPVTGAGGSGTLSYGVAPVLPAGLSFSTATGSIIGTPTAVSPAASYTVTVTDANGATATASFSLTVNPATSTLNWAAPASIGYGTPLSTNQLDATASVSGSFAYNPPAGTVLPPGMHTLTATFTPADRTDYMTPQPVTVALNVTSATLTVTANGATRIYGSPNPAFTGTVTSAVNGDTFTESFSTSATVTSDVGTYPIVPSVTGTDLADYSVQSTNGALTITQAASATTLSASSGSITSGQSLTLTASVTDATPNSTGTPTGAVSFFDGSTLLGTTALSGGTGSYVTSSLAPGVTHTLTASYSGDVNFTASNAGSAVSVPVAALDFTLTMNGTESQTVVPGAVATYSFNIAPEYGVYPGPVMFSVAGLPPGAVATFSPTSLAVNGGAQTVVLTVQTASPTAKTSHPFEREVPLALGVLLLPFLSRRRVRGGLLSLMIAAALLAGVVSISGCGSQNGFNGQAVKNYNLTVIATSSQIAHSFDVNLTLQ